MKKRYRVSGTQPLEIPRLSGIYREPGWEGEADDKDMGFYLQIGAAEEVKGTVKTAGSKAKKAKRSAALSKRQASPFKDARHSMEGATEEERS